MVEYLCGGVGHVHASYIGGGCLVNLQVFNKIAVRNGHSSFQVYWIDVNMTGLKWNNTTERQLEK